MAELHLNLRHLLLLLLYLMGNMLLCTLNTKKALIYLSN